MQILILTLLAEKNFKESNSLGKWGIFGWEEVASWATPWITSSDYQRDVYGVVPPKSSTKENCSTIAQLIFAVFCLFYDLYQCVLFCNTNDVFLHLFVLICHYCWWKLDHNQGFPQIVQASRHYDALVFYPDASVSAVTLQ